MYKFYTLRKKLASQRILLLLLTALFCLESFGQGPGTALSYNPQTINANTLPNAQYVFLPSGVVSTVNQSFTIEAWVYWRGTYDASSPSGDVFQRIFDFGTGTGTNMWLTPKSNYNLRNGVMFAYITAAPGVQVIQSSTPLPTNTWVHIAVTLDHATNTGKLYINGVLDNTATNTSMTIRPSDLGVTTNNYFGKSQFAPDPPFNGIIDEFRISNIVRYTSNFTPTTTQFTPDANTVALYHFNEGSGQTTADASGHGFTGTLGFSTASEPDLDPTWITNSILPVKIEWFTAENHGSSINLKWQAFTTGEGGEFDIERSSDGISFKSIGTVDMTNNAGSFGYSFTDANPLQAKNYYRLRILENNATPILSSTVWVDMSGRGKYDVYPTTAQSQLFVSVPQESQLLIYNAGGSLVDKIKISASQNINVGHLSKGLYYIQFEGTTHTAQFIKL